MTPSAPGGAGARPATSSSAPTPSRRCPPPTGRASKASTTTTTTRRSGCWPRSRPPNRSGTRSERQGDGAYAFTRFGEAAFELGGESLSLELYWLEGYGGGVFLPVADATSGKETYGAGRYVLDTVKGADLGTQDGRLVLDFNFAYNPSCSYDPAWVCPLATPSNRLRIPIRAGERHPSPPPAS